MLRKLGFIFVLSVGITPELANGEDWSASWWTIDSGGEIRMLDVKNDTGWEVSGTIGQWDSTNTDGSASGHWELTGGFWSASIADTDFLFKDSFENPTFPGSP